MNRRAWMAIAVAAGLALGGWAAWRSVRSRPPAASPPGGLVDGAGGTGGPARPPTSGDLLASRYNAVLQVRANDPQGHGHPVGTALPRRLSLILVDAQGREYAEQFDRVGLWAIDIPPGTYRIPGAQTGLGEWRWKLTGESLRPAGKDGWSLTIEAEKMNPTIDLLLY